MSWACVSHSDAAATPCPLSMATTEGGTSHGEMTGAGVFREYLLRGMIFFGFSGQKRWDVEGGEGMVEVGLRVWDEGFGEVRRKVLSICFDFGVK
jgi:hypothetical protein